MKSGSFIDLCEAASTVVDILDSSSKVTDAPSQVKTSLPRQVRPPVGKEKLVIYVPADNSTPGNKFWVDPYTMYQMLSEKPPKSPPSGRPPAPQIPNTVHNREPTVKELLRLNRGKEEVKKRTFVLGKILEKLPTIYVDGNSRYQTMAVRSDGVLLININFANAITFEELVGVLAHEAMHIYLKHLKRLGGRDMWHSNVATDTAINYLLVKEGYKLPGGGFSPPANQWGQVRADFDFNALIVRSPAFTIITGQPELMCYYIKLTASAENNWEEIYKSIVYSVNNEERITYCVGDIIMYNNARHIVMEAIPTSSGMEYDVEPLPPELAETLKL